MEKTRALRQLVTSKLQTVTGGTYHRNAPPDATYPYKVYSLTDTRFTDARDDIELEVDLWDRAPDWKAIEDLADQIEAIFHDANLPTPPIYPTFFRDARYALEDPDKTLQHIKLRFLVQLYKEE